MYNTDEAKQTDTLRIKKINAMFLFGAAVVDVSLGITSCIVQNLGWQIASLFASVLTALIMLQMILCFKPENKREKRGNIFGLTISAIDMITGILSVLIAAASIATVFAAGIMAYKAIKIGVQTEKTIKLSDNVVKYAGKYGKTAGKIIIIPILKKILGGKQNMDKFKEILTALAAFLKRNKWTTTGTVVAVLVEAVAVALSDYLAYMQYISTLGLPDGAVWTIVAVGGLLIFAAVVLPTIISIKKQGNETQEQYDARLATEAIKKIPDSITLDDEQTIVSARTIFDTLSEAALKLITEATKKKLTDAETKIVELNSAEFAKAEIEAKKNAEYQTAYISAVQAGTFSGSLDEYISAQKEQMLAAEWKKAVIDGTCKISFAEYKLTH